MVLQRIKMRQIQWVSHSGLPPRRTSCQLIAAIVLNRTSRCNQLTFCLMSLSSIFTFCAVTSARCYSARSINNLNFIVLSLTFTEYLLYTALQLPYQPTDHSTFIASNFDCNVPRFGSHHYSLDHQTDLSSYCLALHSRELRGSWILQGSSYSLPSPPPLPVGDLPYLPPSDMINANGILVATIIITKLFSYYIHIMIMTA